MSARDEEILSQGLDYARMLVRMLQVPDRRVQLAAAQILAESGERARFRIEEIARQEEDQGAGSLAERLAPWRL